MLVPHSQTGQSTRRTKDRTKLPRLHGADIYVARLGWTTSTFVEDTGSCCAALPNTSEDALPRLSSTGSLHEELSQPLNRPEHVMKTNSQEQERRPSVLSSRPCYRCISYMSSVGIKRVFWTTGSDTWESAKARDLVDALDKLGQEQPSNAAATLNNIFVTKHEVLMLRRTMGNS